MGVPLTPWDAEHEDDRDRREREHEARLERLRHAPPPMSPEQGYLPGVECPYNDPDCSCLNKDRPPSDGTVWTPPAREPTHCSTCGKPLSARLLCHACGDETDHSTWVKGDLSGLADVFDSRDSGERRRAEDEAA